MELAKWPLAQEILLHQTSPTYAAFGSVILPIQAVFGGVALVSSCLFQLSSSTSRASWPETRRQAVVFSCLFQLSPARRREPCPMFGHQEESSGRSQWPFRFSPTRSFFRLPLSLFQLAPPPVRPAPLFVEQVVVQRPNLVFGRSKSSRKR